MLTTLCKRLTAQTDRGVYYIMIGLAVSLSLWLLARLATVDYPLSVLAVHVRVRWLCSLREYCSKRHGTLSLASRREADVHTRSWEGHFHGHNVGTMTSEAPLKRPTRFMLAIDCLLVTIVILFCSGWVVNNQTSFRKPSKKNPEKGGKSLSTTNIQV